MSENDVDSNLVSESGTSLVDRTATDITQFDLEHHIITETDGGEVATVRGRRTVPISRPEMEDTDMRCEERKVAIGKSSMQRNPSYYGDQCLGERNLGIIRCIMNAPRRPPETAVRHSKMRPESEVPCGSRATSRHEMEMPSISPDHPNDSWNRAIQGCWGWPGNTAGDFWCNDWMGEVKNNAWATGGSGQVNHSA